VVVDICENVELTHSPSIVRRVIERRMSERRPPQVAVVCEYSYRAAGSRDVGCFREHAIVFSSVETTGY
jgi:hypothetical protein